MKISGFQAAHPFGKSTSISAPGSAAPRLTALLQGESLQNRLF